MREGAICDLKYFAGKANELYLLRDRVAELEELLGLSGVANADIAALGLSRSEATIVGVLFKRRECISRTSLWTAMYGSAAECDQPHERLIDVWLCKARRKLRRYGVEIGTVRQHGWFMSEENKARLRQHMEAARA